MIGETMRKRTSIVILVLLIAAFSNFAEAAKKQVIKAPGGTTISGYGLVIDASYDPKLDNFIPGYKMLNVAIVNNSLSIIAMNPKKDEWWIKTKNDNKKYRAIGDLRSEDAIAWNSLSDRARNLVGYPLLLAIGARQVIDLFVPDKVPIEDFSVLIVNIESMSAQFEILARQ